MPLKKSELYDTLPSSSDAHLSTQVNYTMTYADTCISASKRHVSIIKTLFAYSRMIKYINSLSTI